MCCYLVFNSTSTIYYYMLQTYHNTWAHMRWYTLDLNLLMEVQQLQQKF
jgi:hypothetical protein